MPTPTRPWIVLQLADSAFPTGGFAHSLGLEAALALGEVHGPDDLRSFCEQSLWQTGLGALPFAAASLREPAGIAAHDALLDAMLSSHVANRASRAQGRAFVSTCSGVWGAPLIGELDGAVRSRALRGHHAPLFGAVFGALGLTASEMADVFLHLALRGVVSAAVRLGLLGPREAQRLQYDLASLAETVSASCRELPLEEACQPAPLLDLFGAHQDRLYARLFQS
jgi:urease accessory protein